MQKYFKGNELEEEITLQQHCHLTGVTWPLKQKSKMSGNSFSCSHLNNKINNWVYEQILFKMGHKAQESLSKKLFSVICN